MSEGLKDRDVTSRGEDPWLGLSLSSPPLLVICGRAYGLNPLHPILSSKVKNVWLTERVAGTECGEFCGRVIQELNDLHSNTNWKRNDSFLTMPLVGRSDFMSWGRKSWL